MRESTLTNPEIEEEISRLLLWREAVGKVFKLTCKSYGVRTVTYTKVNAVKESEHPEIFDIEVSCAEISARVHNSKRAHSSVCKEGTIQQDEDSILLPSNFGEECRPQEFEKISDAILTHATANLDRVTQPDSEEKNEAEVPIDLPHLRLTDMEASLVQNSPFLLRNVYLLSTNSRKAAFESINEELRRASRNSRLTDALDPVYVAQKNDAITSLRNKLNRATPEISGPTLPPPSVAERNPVAQIEKRETPAPLSSGTGGEGSGARAPQASAPVTRRLGFTLIEKKNNLVFALHGKPSAANLSWARHNPSKEGAVFRIGKECGLLEFVQWAHVSGRAASAQEAAGKNVHAYFCGPDESYTGPDHEGIYPSLRFESPPPNRAAAGA